MIKRFKNKHKGETCVVIGNGPSLKETPLELLDAYTTFGANKIYLLPYSPTYYTVIDREMLETLDLPCGETMFIRDDFYVPNAYPIKCTIKNGFSLKPYKEVVMGGTVTYANLQIAYYMGFETVLLVGCDHTYGKYNAKSPGKKFVADGNDDAHFHPDYFKKGETYNAPELRGTEIFYTLAKAVYERDNRKIINLTPGTHLHVFEKGKFEDWI